MGPRWVGGGGSMSYTHTRARDAWKHIPLLLLSHESDHGEQPPNRLKFAAAMDGLITNPTGSQLSVKAAHLNNSQTKL